MHALSAEEESNKLAFDQLTWHTVPEQKLNISKKMITKEA